MNVVLIVSLALSLGVVQSYSAKMIFDKYNAWFGKLFYALVFGASTYGELWLIVNAYKLV